MKKLLGIIVLSLLLSGNVYAFVSKKLQQQYIDKGLIKVGNIDEAVNLALRWIAKSPKLKKNNFFTLKKMLKNTLNVYEKSINEKRETSLEKKVNKI